MPGIKETSEATPNMHVLQPLLNKAVCITRLYHSVAYISYLAMIVWVTTTVMPWNAKAQELPPSAGLESMVDPFTGDLSYSVPLLVVPGPNGEQFPITLSYQSGGIGVEQRSGTVGLGWDLELGTIKRQVNGVPDDIANKNSHTKRYTRTASTLPENNHIEILDNLNKYGPIHFDQINANIISSIANSNSTQPSMDLYASSTDNSTDNRTVWFPDYDNYYMITPFSSSKIRLFNYEYRHVFSAPIIYNKDKNHSLVTNFQIPYMANLYQHSFIFDQYTYFTKKPAMIFDLETMTRTYNPFNYDNIASASGNTSNHTNAPLSFYPEPTNDSPIIHTDYFTLSNLNKIQHLSGRRIEYYTNREILNHLNGTNPIPGFIDWKMNSQNERILLDENNIGAIVVYNDDGYKYHFSLPVISKNEKTYIFDLDQNSLYANNLPIPHSTSWWVDEINNSWNYVSEWKLTGITGMDFKDNGNGVLDNDDKGYWIAIDYVKWTDNFSDRFPLFGYNIDPIATIKNKTRHDDSFLVSQGIPYKRSGSTMSLTTEIYYTNSVRTSSHSALFFYSLKCDDFSVDNTPIPLLKLENIYLFNNNDIKQINLSPDTKPTNNYFSHNIYEHCSNENVYNTQQLIETNISLKSIEGVKLLFDYSLAGNYDRNIKSGYASHLYSNPITWTSPHNPTFSITIGYNKPNNISNEGLGDNGKLTLKSIVNTGYAGITNHPSHDFDYYINDENSEYLYDPVKIDNSGLYKLDRSNMNYSKYVTQNSAAHLHAWSLKKITTPLGASINIEYEADEYEKVGTSFPKRFIILNGGSKISNNRIDVNFYHDPVIEDVIEDHINMPGSTSILAYRPFFPCLDEVCTGLSNYDWKYVQCSVSNIVNGNTIVMNSPSTNSFFWSETFQGSINNGDHCYHPAVSCSSTLYDIGYLELTYSKLKGTGIRVKSIKLLNGINHNIDESSIQFTYNDGICTSDPGPIENARHSAFSTTKQMKKLMMSRGGGDRHVPSPSVGYKNCTVTYMGDNDQLIGSNSYKLWNKVGEYQYTRYSHKHMWELSNTGQYTMAEVIVCDEDMSLYGKLLENIKYDNVNKIMYRKKYTYEHHPSSILKEACAILGTVPANANYNPSERAYERSTFVKNIIHRRLISEEEFSNGESRLTKYLDRDRYTGEPRTIITERSDGSVEQVDVTPAYELYSEMGPNVLDGSNQNNLGAVASTTSSLGTGSKSTWSSVHRVREFSDTQQAYTTELTEGPWLPDEQFTKVKGTGEEWKYLGRTTLRDTRYRPLEQKNMADHYTARRNDCQELHVIAEGSNTNHASFTFSSFESGPITGTGNDAAIWFDGEFVAPLSSGCVQLTGSGAILPHAGSQLLEVPSGQQAVFRSVPGEVLVNEEQLITGLMKGRTYRAMVWVHRTSPVDAALKLILTGSVNTEVTIRKDDPSALIVGDWIRLQARIVVPADLTTSGEQGLSVSLIGGTDGPSYFDDILVYPVDAQVQAACWDERTSLLTHALSAEGFVTKYTHDHTGAVIRVEQETERGYHTVSETEIGYAKPF